MFAAHRYLVSLNQWLASAFPIQAALLTAVILVGIGISGCSTNTPAFEGIANRGIMPVSPQSPFVGSNVFLAQEMEKSLYLYNFMKTRGAPQAMQVLGESEMDSELLMFYSREKEYFSAVPGVDPHTTTKEWIIRGPFPITREHYPHIVHLRPDQTGVFEVFGKREIFGGSGNARESRIIQPAFIPTPAPKPKPARRPNTQASKAKGDTGEESKGPAIAIQGTPMNLDQKALLEARRTPPVHHTVTPPAKAAATPLRPSLDDALKSTIHPTPTPLASAQQSPK